MRKSNAQVQNQKKKRGPPRADAAQFKRGDRKGEASEIWALYTYHRLHINRGAGTLRLSRSSPPRNDNEAGPPLDPGPGNDEAEPPALSGRPRLLHVRCYTTASVLSPTPNLALCSSNSLVSAVTYFAWSSPTASFVGSATASPTSKGSPNTIS